MERLTLVSTGTVASTTRRSLHIRVVVDGLGGVLVVGNRAEAEGAERNTVFDRVPFG
jgi:hypothetical protein